MKQTKTVRIILIIKTLGHHAVQKHKGINRYFCSLQVIVCMFIIHCSKRKSITLTVI